jgi:hypothetical protein
LLLFIVAWTWHFNTFLSNVSQQHGDGQTVLVLGVTLAVFVFRWVRKIFSAEV